MISHEYGEIIEADRRFIILLIIARMYNSLSILWRDTRDATREWISCLSSRRTPLSVFLIVRICSELRRIAYESRNCATSFCLEWNYFAHVIKSFFPVTHSFVIDISWDHVALYVYRACIYWILWKMIIRLSPISNFDTIFLAHKNWEEISSAILQFSI